MRLFLATTAMVTATAITALAQAPCHGLAFDKTCTAPTTPNVRASFGTPFTPTPLTVVPQGNAASTPEHDRFFDKFWVAAPTSAITSSSPAIDCAMLKHTTLGDDAKLVRKTHPAYTNARDVIPVPLCANPTTSPAKK
jgi:hypothetical protein